MSHHRDEDRAICLGIREWRRGGDGRFYDEGHGGCVHGRVVSKVQATGRVVPRASDVVTADDSQANGEVAVWEQK